MHFDKLYRHAEMGVTLIERLVEIAAALLFVVVLLYLF